ncbi:hypothetical protein ACMGE7_10595 [Macrococcus equi]|uniref:hypothetical protein n=1 Tax=Macrococcus equi TaxID=3395462 RepID=UPI0039BE0C21
MEEKKSLEEINKEIEEQLIYEMENKEEEEDKKKRRAIFSVTGVIMLFFALRLLYGILKPFF